MAPTKGQQNKSSNTSDESEAEPENFAAKVNLNLNYLLVSFILPHYCGIKTNFCILDGPISNLEHGLINKLIRPSFITDLNQFGFGYFPKFCSKRCLNFIIMEITWPWVRF